MIFPARTKNFYFAANTGTEYADFWNNLWQQAASVLESAERVVLCGYSLSPVDERAHKLLLSAPKKDAEIVVASGDDTQCIVGAYRNTGYVRAVAADEVLFQKWVGSSASNVVGML